MYLPGFNFCFTSISYCGCVGGEGLNIFELIFMCFFLIQFYDQDSHLMSSTAAVAPW